MGSCHACDFSDVWMGDITEHHINTCTIGKKYRTMTLLKIALHCMQLAYNLLDSSDESQTTSISCKRSCFLNSISRVQ